MRADKALYSAIPDLPRRRGYEREVAQVARFPGGGQEALGRQRGGRSVVIWAGPAQLRIQAFGDGESAP